MIRRLGRRRRGTPTFVPIPGAAAAVRALVAEEEAIVLLTAIVGPNPDRLAACVDEARRRADVFADLYAGSRSGCPDYTPFVSGLKSVTDDVQHGRIP